MMKRVAVIFESSPFDRKGLFNAVHNRVKGLLDSGQCHVDVYCIQSQDNSFTRRVRHRVEVPRVDSVTIEGVTYRMMWYRFSIIDSILFDRLSIKPLFFPSFMRKMVGLLAGYDMLIAHSFVGGLVASEAHARYGIPYIVTWHGSDIHTHPHRNSLQLSLTRHIIADARCNFFVSRALLQESDRIVGDMDVNREVNYNGVSEGFCRFSEDERLQLRAKYGIADNVKVVAFAGNLAAVKNVRTLAPIFQRVSQLYEGEVVFWVIGDGKLRSAVEADHHGLCNVRFWGNVPSEEMPAIHNCIDVLVLPSLNEGLSLVCLEAVSCGAAVVASDVGGNSEIVGKDNVVPLGEHFASRVTDGFINGMAEKINHLLVNPTTQVVPSDMSWDAAVSKELLHILSV